MKSEAQWRTAFWKELAPIGHQGYSQNDCFRTFLELAFRALYGRTLSNPDDVEANESAYKKCLQRTQRPRETAMAASAALAIVVDALDELEREDFLGPLMMDAGAGNAAAGQFFTPTSVCKAMAQMTVADVDPESQPTFSVLEPAGGAGAMLLATATEFERRGVDRLRLRCELWDIDERCAWASYVQLTLCAIPAVVVHGNTLSMERWGTWPTPLMSRSTRIQLYAQQIVSNTPAPAATTQTRPQRVRVVIERTTP